MSIQRRQLLAIAGLAGINLLAAGVGTAAEQRNRGLGNGLDRLKEKRTCLIHVMLKGGNDGLNTVAPLHDPLYARLRPTLAITRSEGLPLAEGMALNPSLRSLMPHWERGHCQIHLGVMAPATGSHVNATSAWHAHNQDQGAGWIAQALTTTSSPTYGLAFGDDQAAITGGHMIAITMDASNDTGFVTTVENSPAIRHRKEMAQLIQRAIAQAPSSGFSHTILGRRFHHAAALLASGLTPSAIVITHDGYDTHAEQRQTHDALLADLAGSLDTFARAMQAVGRWNDVVVMTGSEFGRSAAENAAGGTDHGSHNCHFLLGGKVEGGLIGRQPSLADSSVAGSNLATLRRAASTAVPPDGCPRW